MDSPIFGNSKSSRPSFRQTQVNVPSNSRQIQNVLAIFIIERNIKKLVASLNKICSKIKRGAFLNLNTRQLMLRRPGHNITVRQSIYVMKIEYDLTRIFTLLIRVQLKQKINAFSRIKRSALLIDLEEDKLSAINTDRLYLKSRKASQWKENSNFNILDLSLENKKLKNQISKDQAEEEQFIEKMSALLDVHEKVRPQNIKRK